MNLGLFVGASVTFAIEVAQFFVPGHRFSLLELAGKVFLIGIGLSLALVARYDKAIKIGPIRLTLFDPYALA